MSAEVMSSSSSTGSNERPNYVSIIAIAGRGHAHSGYTSPELVIMPHSSLAEVVNRLNWLGYIVGEPAPGLSYAAIETYDGKPLSSEEKDYLTENGVTSRVDYVRMSGITGEFGRRRGQDPEVVAREFLTELDGGAGTAVSVAQMAITVSAWREQQERVR